MKRIGITQRVEKIIAQKEYRDCLDQRWPMLIHNLGYFPIPLSNIKERSVSELVDILQLDAIILSGGNSIAALDPSATDAAPNRDIFEQELIKEALKREIPIIGICRGMQLLNLYFGGKLSPIQSHVACTHKLNIRPEYCKNIPGVVNSYHNWGIQSSDLATELEVMATDQEDNIEAFICVKKSVMGVMWHPEREMPFKQKDMKLIKEFLL